MLSPSLLKDVLMMKSTRMIREVFFNFGMPGLGTVLSSRECLRYWMYLLKDLMGLF